jgi:hypothetical protein
VQASGDLLQMSMAKPQTTCSSGQPAALTPTICPAASLGEWLVFGPRIRTSLCH